MAEHLYLSPPDISDVEKAYVMDALESGWVAPLGPHVDAFESEVASFVGAAHAVALSSGTAALHLGLLALGVGRDDDVLVPTLTFGATAFAVTYTGARPVFVDSEPTSWNIDPGLVADYLATAARAGALPSAVLPVDLFGRPADYDRLRTVCDRYEIPVLVDAAEALGARHGSSGAGTTGRAGVFSFNGNKIMTTSGGGMLVTDDAQLADRVRYLATQARQPVAWYEHLDIGFNYRMSNVLAAMGRGQLLRLPDFISRRKAIAARYGVELDGVLEVTTDPPWGQSNAWLTTALLNPGSPLKPGQLTRPLGERRIEARHVWKPMHLQPVFQGLPVVGGAIAEDIFTRGICLPSGQRMSNHEVDNVVAIVRDTVSRLAGGVTGGVPRPATPGK